MSPLDQACTLLADLLNDGPRNAAEILAAAEGAKIAGRTMQRAAEQMGVVKMKAGFDGGWTWALPGPVEVRQERSRAEVIASRLRKWEAAQGRKAPVYAADPRLVRLVEAGITDADLREAYEMATTYDDAPLTVARLAACITVAA